MRAHSHGTVSPELCKFIVPLLNRGRRESRAPDAPVDPVRRSTRASRMRKAHGQGLQVQPGHPGFPRAMALRLIRALPGERPFLPPLLHGPYQQRSARVAAPGPHDFAVRCRRFVRQTKARLTPQASIATRTTFRDDRETSLWWHGLRRNIILICGTVKS